MAKLEGVQVKGRRNTPASTPVAPKAVTLNITKPGLGQHLKLVLFGPPKTLKTRTSVSGQGKKLLILCEPDGDLSLIGRDDVDVVRPSTGQELADVILALHQGAVADYDWIILDSVTFAFEILGRTQIAKAVAANVDIRKPYGQVGAALTQIIHDLVALPTNVVFIAQLKQDQLDEDDPDSAGPEEGKFPFTMAVTPMVYKILAPAVSIVGRTYKRMIVGPDGNKKVQYMVSFEDYGKSPAGSRIEGVPSVVEELQLDALVDSLKGALK
jgi:hypothetical protein